MLIVFLIFIDGVLTHLNALGSTKICRGSRDNHCDSKVSSQYNYAFVYNSF